MDWRSCWPSFWSRSAAQESFFEDGNRLYQQGDYQAALDNYLRILIRGSRVAPFTTTSATRTSSSAAGRSHTTLRAGAAPHPGRRDLRANLELARSLTVDEISPYHASGCSVLSLVGGLLPRGWLALLVGAGYLGDGGLVVAILKRGNAAAGGRAASQSARPRRPIFGINLAVLELGIGQPAEAIIMAEEVAVQSAPSDDRALQVFTIHEGTKVRVEQRTEEWVEIVLEDGKVGWVRVNVLEVI